MSATETAPQDVSASLEVPRYLRLSIGEKPGSGPKGPGYFRVTRAPTDKGSRDFVVVQSLQKKLVAELQRLGRDDAIVDGKPVEVPFEFVSDDLPMYWMTYRGLFIKRGWVCRRKPWKFGDPPGVALRRKPTKSETGPKWLGDPTEVECNPKTCPKAIGETPECKACCVLSGMFLPWCAEYAYFTSRGYHSIRQLEYTILSTWAEFNRQAARLPLFLKVKQEQGVQTGFQFSTVHLVRGDDHAILKAVEARQRIEQALGRGRSVLPAYDAWEDAKALPALVAEFQPETNGQDVGGWSSSNGKPQRLMPEEEEDPRAAEAKRDEAQAIANGDAVPMQQGEFEE